MESSTFFLVALVALALAFDYVNGFHDSANSIATVVSTRVLSPGKAVLWAAFCNFIAFLIFGVGVAKTVGKDLVDLAMLKPVLSQVILSGLAGAIAWDLITWYMGLPTSSSHALMGGYGGAAVAAMGGFGAIRWEGWVTPVLFIVFAPLIGLIMGFILMMTVTWICRRLRPAQVDRHFRKLQLLSSGLYSLGHGSNDAQKTAGIITGVLVAYNIIDAKAFEPPMWVILSCYGAIALGTLAGGWRIVKTMGMRITDLRPVDGFAAETAGAMTLYLATALHIPVSTTHTITGSIVGVGSIKRFSAVRWGVAARIVWAWVLTIPASAGIAWLTFRMIQPR